MRKFHTITSANLSRIILITLVYLVFFARFLKNSFSYLDPDFGWHLRVGHDIWLSKDIVRLNTYNFDFLNISWVDHEWLFNVIVYLIYNYAGYVVLTIFFALLPICSLWLLVKLTRIISSKPLDNAGKNELWAYFYILAFFGFYASLPHLGIRMQELSVVFVTMLLLLLYRFEAHGKHRTLYVLPILFYAWANLHGGFLIGFFILAVWFVLKIFVCYLPKNFGKTFIEFGRFYQKKDFTAYIIWSFSSFLVTLLTPYGLELYSFLLTYSDTYYAKHIYEWLPFYYYPLYVKQLFYMALYISFFITYIHAVRANPGKTTKTPFSLFVLSFVFFLLSLKSKRHFPLFFLTSLPLMTWWLLTSLEISKTNVRHVFSHLAVKYFGVATLLLLSGYFLVTTSLTFEPFHSYCQQYPCKALEHMKSNRHYRDKNIFNMYQWGGYLVWMWPEKKIFIDGRFPQYVIHNHTLLEEYHQFFNKERTPQKLNQYDIDAVLLSKEPKPTFRWYEKTFASFQALENDKFDELGEYLRSDSEWKIDYEDQNSIIFIIQVID